MIEKSFFSLVPPNINIFSGTLHSS